MDIYGYIYLIRNRVNGKVYVGQTIRTIAKRWSEHKSSHTIAKKTASAITRAIVKYGPEAFDVVELGRAYSKNELHDMEKMSILNHASRDPEFGYNLTLGGDGTVGFRHSDEMKAKLSVERKGIPTGRTPSEASRLATSERNRNRVYTEEQRKRMSEAQTGLVHGPPSEETRRKLSEAKLGQCSDALRESCRRQAAAMKGKPGKKRTPEQKQRYSDAAKQRWAKGISEETRHKMSEAQKNKAAPSEATRLKMSESQSKRQPITEAQRETMSAAQTLVWSSPEADQRRQAMKTRARKPMSAEARLAIAESNRRRTGIPKPMPTKAERLARAAQGDNT